MLTLNLVPGSNVALSKPKSYQYPINAHHRAQNPGESQLPLGLFHKPRSLASSNLIRIRGYPFGFGAKPSFQIRDTGARGTSLDTGDEYPSGVGAKPRSWVAKASEFEGEAEVPKPNKTLQLAVVFGMWYFQNIVFNIYNKKALNLFPFPWLMASFQLFVGSVWMLILWSLKLQPCPKISRRFIVALLGPALFHTIGHISACISFSKVAVSFTHVIKSSEPVFSVIFSTLLGDNTYPLRVWLSIMPIVLGCSLAAVTEVSFNPQGLWGALISNVGFVLRNIYSKRSLDSFKEVNGLNMYGWISIISLLYLFPVAIFVEGSQWVAGYHKAIQAVGKPVTFYIWVMLSGLFYHLYNQSSYQALDDISPLTFSVGNTMKRVVVIIATVLVFRNPVKPLNALGSAIAVFGTFLYSQASSKKSPKKIEGEKSS